MVLFEVSSNCEPLRFAAMKFFGGQTSFLNMFRIRPVYFLMRINVLLDG